MLTNVDNPPIEKTMRKNLLSHSRVFNFSAGPATLPEAVLQQIQQDLFNWNQQGASVMELSHRGPAFRELAEQSKQDLRDLLAIPDDYTILFLAGGGRSQYAMVPMNLLADNKTAAYVKTGSWSKIAIDEAQKYANVNIVCDMEADNFTHIAPQSDWRDFSDAAYLHYVDNETVHGVEFTDIPNSHGLPLVGDMSSNILSRSFDVKQFGLFYACAQKNLGIAGITIAVIRNDLLQRQKADTTPSMFNYELHAENNSLLNTAPTFPWYVSSLVLKWIKQQGGVDKFDQQNRQKSQLLYNVIDQSGLYNNPVAPQNRSRMNVVFTIPNQPELETTFIKQASEQGLCGLKGHRFLGGMRASIYNAMPIAGVEQLVAFMQHFEKRYG